ncbi:MAG: hypothetical protein PVF85_01635 [Anaerolineales bacterium]|jgi:hypothetical protein
MHDDKPPYRHPLFLAIALLLTISGCGQVTSKAPAATPSPGSSPASAPPTEGVEGFLKFPYLSADAGNFNLQAGEQITVTWVDAPPGANKYLLVVLNLDGKDVQTLAMTLSTEDEVQAVWMVPPDFTGTLEGHAYFDDGYVARSGCCTLVYSNRMPPEGICSLVTTGMMPQQLYEQRADEIERIIGIAPGLYLEALARSTGGWYRVRTIPTEGTTDGNSDPVTSGWFHSVESTRFFGPCDGIPLETLPEGLQQGVEESSEPGG